MLKHQEELSKRSQEEVFKMQEDKFRQFRSVYKLKEPKTREDQPEVSENADPDFQSNSTEDAFQTRPLRLEFPRLIPKVGVIELPNFLTII